MTISVQSHENLILLIGHFHSLDEYGRERSEMLEKAASVAFDCTIVYEADEPSYGRYESEDLKGGRRLTGTIKSTDHKLTVDLPASMNEAVKEMMPEDEVQVTLIIEKWDSVYERFGAVAATLDTTSQESRNDSDSSAVNEILEPAQPTTPLDSESPEPGNLAETVTQDDSPIAADPVQAPEREERAPTTEPKASESHAADPSRVARANPTAGQKRTAFDAEQGVGEGFEGDSDKLITFASFGCIAIVVIGGLIVYALYSIFTK